MLYNYLRVIKGDNGSLSDVSLDNQDKNATLQANLVVSEDYLYLGQHYPFNNFFAQVDTANVNSANMQIEYWDSQAWRNAVDIIDGTSLQGKSLARSGVVQFSPDSDFHWGRTADTTEGEFPTDLSSVTIYNMYWLRISFSASLDASTELKRIAYAFTSHQQLENLDTTIRNYIDDFKDEGQATKTTWDDEIITASELLVLDLKASGIIVNRGELLRFDDLYMACNYRTLMLIFDNLGGDYEGKLAKAEARYAKALPSRMTLDKNHDARASFGEIDNSVRELTR